MLSPNMLKTFKTCPIKYKFKYIEKINIPQNNTLFQKGKKIHALANYYLRGDEINKLESALTNEEKYLWKKLKSNEYFQKIYVNSEYNLSCKIGDFWIGGRLDAIVKDNNQDFYYILDYKTGAIPKNPQYDFQTMVYLLAASKKFNGNIKFVYIDLMNNKNHIIDFDNEKQAEYENIIIETCKKLDMPFENIEHSKICEFCEYKKICII